MPPEFDARGAKNHREANVTTRIQCCHLQKETHVHSQGHRISPSNDESSCVETQNIVYSKYISQTGYPGHDIS